MSGWAEHAFALVGPVPPVAVLKADERAERLEGILTRTAQSLGLTVEDLRGPSRQAQIVKVRKIAMAEARDAGFSLSVIGTALGGRHHTTVLSGIRSLAPYRGGT